MKIVIATRNKGKLAQYTSIFRGAGVDFCTLDDIGYTREVIEDSGTFEGNSFLKANQIHQDTGLAALGDDSGLVINALDGRPGVDTAYYAGDENTPRLHRLNTLLAEMKDKTDRSARFETHITCILEDGRVVRSKYFLNGSISKEIVDLNVGLTFEPVFIPEGYDKTLSQFDQETKLKITHRAKAVQKLLEELRGIGVIK